MFNRLRQFVFHQRLQAKIKKHEPLLLPALLVFGFIADVVTFRTLSPQTTFIVTGIYAALAGLAIVFSNIYDVRPDHLKHPILNYLRLSTTFVIQFTFGALLSSSFLFYWFSGSFAVSWPLIIVLAGLMTTAEILRKFYLQPAIQFAVFTFVLFSYFSVLFPFLLQTLEPSAFIFGGTLSSLIILLLITIMVTSKSVIDRVYRQLVLVALVVFGVMNGLYFANIIPPIPLFIRDAAVYHDLTGAAGDYTLIGETETFLENLWPGQTIHRDQDGRLYVYTAIFAPTDLTTTIYHHWEFYDPAQGRWLSSGRPSFAIVGGRQAGFRGYTYKSNVQPGRWRVTVETGRGQVLGRVGFVYLP